MLFFLVILVFSYYFFALILFSKKVIGPSGITPNFPKKLRIQIVLFTAFNAATYFAAVDAFVINDCLYNRYKISAPAIKNTYFVTEREPFGSDA